MKAAKTSETSVKIENTRISNVIGLIKFKVLKDNLEVENSIKSATMHKSGGHHVVLTDLPASIESLRVMDTITINTLRIETWLINLIFWSFAYSSLIKHSKKTIMSSSHAEVLLTQTVTCCDFCTLQLCYWI